MTSFIKVTLALSFFFCCYNTAQADDFKSIVATLHNIQGKNQLNINLRSILNKKQKKIITSGFSTYSHVRFIISGNETLNQQTEIACTIKYDTWEEQYQLIKIAADSKVTLSASLDDFNKTCLSFNIVNPELIAQFLSGKVEISASLSIEQISSSQAKQIKSWLIQQQSDVMQGLFSHMLGDLTLSNNTKIKILRTEGTRNRTLPSNTRLGHK